MSKTFLITGVSTGLGLAIARRALAAGHRVAGTVRTEQHAAAFQALDPDRARAFILDLSDADRIDPTVRAAEAELGPVEVLVANAGYGLEGTFEESSMADLRRQFEVNVFGTVATVKASPTTTHCSTRSGPAARPSRVRASVTPIARATPSSPSWTRRSLPCISCSARTRYAWSPPGANASRTTSTPGRNSAAPPTPPKAE